MTNLSESALLRHNMLNWGDKIVVGLSGGADSVALTHSLKEMGCKLVACHINHCLRGEESNRDEAFVKEFCKELSIPVKVVTVDVLSYASEHGMTVEEAGRKIRYAAFEETRKEFNAQKIATAHTLSDNLETTAFKFDKRQRLKRTFRDSPCQRKCNSSADILDKSRS